MAKITWTPDLDTGIEPIDQQHRQLVELINQLDDAQLGGDRQAIGKVIEGLIEYTVSHFAFEEALMDDAGYQFVRPHKKVHEIFVRRAKELQDRFFAGEDVAGELQTMLGRWLLNHIRRDDASYVSAVKGAMVRLIEEKEEGGWLSRSLKRFFGRG